MKDAAVKFHGEPQVQPYLFALQSTGSVVANLLPNCRMTPFSGAAGDDFVPRQDKCRPRSMVRRHILDFSFAILRLRLAHYFDNLPSNSDGLRGLFFAGVLSAMNYGVAFAITRRQAFPEVARFPEQ